MTEKLLKATLNPNTHTLPKKRLQQTRIIISDHASYHADFCCILLNAYPRVLKDVAIIIHPQTVFVGVGYTVFTLSVRLSFCPRRFGLSLIYMCLEKAIMEFHQTLQLPFAVRLSVRP